MKKILTIGLITIGLITIGLVACSNSEEKKMKGTWERTKDNTNICSESFKFLGENNFQIQNSRIQGGETSSGTYKHIEGEEYQFDYGGGYDIFTIKPDEDKKTLTIQMAGSKNSCKYKKTE